MDAAEKTPAQQSAQAAGTAETLSAGWPAQGWFEGRYVGRETFCQLLRERIEERLRRSTAGFPASVLGL